MFSTQFREMSGKFPELSGNSRNISGKCPGTGIAFGRFGAAFWVPENICQFPIRPRLFGLVGHNSAPSPFWGAPLGGNGSYKPLGVFRAVQDPHI